jgi:hypothetical protein
MPAYRIQSHTWHKSARARRATRSILGHRRSRICFNAHPHTAGDNDKLSVTGDRFYCFNPRTRTGCDSIDKRCRRFPVSIHAPARALERGFVANANRSRPRCEYQTAGRLFPTKSGTFIGRSDLALHQAYIPDECISHFGAGARVRVWNFRVWWGSDGPRRVNDGHVIA